MSGASDGIEYEIQLTPFALEMLAKVKDRREQEKLAERIDQLKIEPGKTRESTGGQSFGISQCSSSWATLSHHL